MYIDPNKLYGGPPVSARYDADREHKEESKATFDISKLILAKVSTLEGIVTPPPEDVMNSRQLCAYLQIKPNQLYKLRQKYHLPCHKPTGKPLYFYRQEIKEWLVTNGANHSSSIRMPQ